jgi:hypothetical protein
MSTSAQIVAAALIAAVPAAYLLMDVSDALERSRVAELAARRDRDWSAVSFRRGTRTRRVRRGTIPGMFARAMLGRFRTI